MLIDALTTKENIERAFDNALAERLRSEHVCFPSEIAIARESKPEIIASIHKILMHPECYEPEFGFYYTMPKTELVNRHLVYLPFKELVIHYCFIQVLAERLDLQLQTTCFANRLELDKKALRLSEEFAQKSWPAYCDWQKLNGSKYSAMLKTDLSSFFDNVDMTLLIEKIAHKLGTDASNPFFKMFKKMLATPSYLYSHKSLLQKHKGIATGPSCMGVLANYYLMDIDNLMCNISGVEYGRYVDDIKLFSDDKDALQQAFSALQEALYTLGLNINGSKTKLLNSQDQVIDLLKEEILVGNAYGDEEEHQVVVSKDTVLASDFDIDERFDERENTFESETGISSADEAKKFCFYLQDIGPEKWTVEHIALLSKIFQLFPSSTKHACWLIVSAWREAEGKSQQAAFKFVSEDIWNIQSIHPYAKSRVLHHLVKNRADHGSYLEQNKDEFLETKFGKSIVSIIGSNNGEDVTVLRCYAFEALRQLRPDFTKADVSKFLKSQNVQLNHSEIGALDSVFMVERTVLDFVFDL